MSLDHSFHPETSDESQGYLKVYLWQGITLIARTYRTFERHEASNKLRSIVPFKNMAKKIKANEGQLWSNISTSVKLSPATFAEIFSNKSLSRDLDRLQKLSTVDGVERIKEGNTRVMLRPLLLHHMNGAQR